MTQETKNIPHLGWELFFNDLALKKLGNQGFFFINLFFHFILRFELALTFIYSQHYISSIYNYRYYRFSNQCETLFLPHFCPILKYLHWKYLKVFPLKSHISTFLLIFIYKSSYKFMQGAYIYCKSLGFPRLLLVYVHLPLQFFKWAIFPDIFNLIKFFKIFF